MKFCKTCQKSKMFFEFSRDKHEKDGFRRYCKLCVFEKFNEKRKVSAKQRGRKPLTKEQKLKDAQRKSLSYHSDPKKFHAQTAKRRAIHKNAKSKWGNSFFIEEAYKLTLIREKLTGIKWHVDHIVPLINDKVCGLHNEFNLQVIPAKENLIKGNRTWPNSF